jgi:uncharacterized protein
MNKQGFVMTIDVRNNRLDYVELPAPDADSLRASKLFYEKAFGWRYNDYGPEYADTQSSGVSSGIAVDPERSTRPLPVLFASDLEGAKAKVIAAGGRLTKEIFSFPGGRRFQFTDPAGNELAVWSDK